MQTVSLIIILIIRVVLFSNFKSILRAMGCCKCKQNTVYMSKKDLNKKQMIIVFMYTLEEGAYSWAWVRCSIFFVFVVVLKYTKFLFFSFVYSVRIRSIKAMALYTATQEEMF